MSGSMVSLVCGHECHVAVGHKLEGKYDRDMQDDGLTNGFSLCDVRRIQLRPQSTRLGL